VDGAMSGSTERRCVSAGPKPANKPEDFVAGYWFSSGSAILFRREPVLAKAGLQDERLVRLEDFDWFLRLAMQGAKLVVQDTIGADIEYGSKPSLAPLAASIDRLREKWLCPPHGFALLPSCRRRFEAYLRLELARTALFERPSAELCGKSRPLLRSESAADAPPRAGVERRVY